MEAILLADVKGTGKKGEVVKVKDGHARNFLIPRGLAKEAGSQALKELDDAKKAEARALEIEKQNAVNSAQVLEGQTVKIPAKAGEKGKLFGSVTSKDIANKIKEVYNIEIDKRKIQLETDIKAFGTYKCEIKMHPGVVANVFVVVAE